MGLSKKWVMCVAICFNLALCSGTHQKSHLLGKSSSSENIGGNDVEILDSSKEKMSATGFSRKLQQGCSEDNIQIKQSLDTPLPSGIPTYLVQIHNVCPTSCGISNIHFHCQEFSSAIAVSPAIFKRIANDDCLVNDGKVLHVGQSLSFKYANSFSYKLSVSSLTCS